MAMREESDLRCWIDENHVLCFQGDVSEEEARELEDVVRAAFNEGLKHGYLAAKAD